MSLPPSSFAQSRGLGPCLALLLLTLTTTSCSLVQPPSLSQSVSQSIHSPASPAPASPEAQAGDRPGTSSASSEASSEASGDAPVTEPVTEPEITDTSIADAIEAGASEPLTPEQEAVLEAIADARVIYLGETHDQVADHQAQLQIIRNLVEQGKTIAIGFEMFQRPFQTALNQYQAGEIDLAQLRLQSEYDERWGFPWGFYSPILDYAQAQQLPILATNTPREITRKVARQGLDALTGDELTWIPPRDEINVKSQDYRTFVKHAFDSFHHHGGHGSSQGGGTESEAKQKAFNNFFAAQVLWDETMADVLAQFLRENPEHTVVMLAGQGHVIYGYGIPSRVQRRLGDDLPQATLLLNPSEAFQTVGEGTIADHFWLSK